MDDLVSKQQAIDSVETIGFDFSNSDLSQMELEELCEAIGDVRWEFIQRLKCVPTAQPKKGKWEIYVISMLDGEGCRCSECGYEGVPYWDFCPNCGSYNGGE